ncbi:hypothetical protein [Pseudomonas coronafaciens]|uniref:hypothetical protein n=1 Tax=Pseudomonas coronafaciens TaxID=53409 RepID=UPI001F406F8C|nr:hypothetical protein [Pseudomonas coronafaciens]
MNFTNAQADQIGAVFAFSGRAGKGDLPALFEKTLDQLHHVPAGCRRAGLWPDVADDQ